MKTIDYPKVTQLESGKVYVSFKTEGKRIRIFNGSKLGIKINPNEYTEGQRKNMGELLAAKVYEKLLSNQGLLKAKKNKSISHIEALTKGLNAKLQENYSKHHVTALNYSYRSLMRNIKGNDVTRESVYYTLNHFKNPTSYNTMRRNLTVLFNEAEKFGLPANLIEGFSKKRAKANLNKPFEDIPAILNEIKTFNYNLYLCCIMTYGCLLRPHREVRELTWGDFTADLSYIKLSGSRNKSGRNRIVPVPSYIKELLNKGDNNLNIFTGTTKAPNPDYFKTIWGRFKKVSKLLEQDQTLYSFRHSGAIEIYKRTGSLSKLQKAMGHSSLAVSLTYLRGLEVSELEESDMPMV
jgi:integrase